MKDKMLGLLITFLFMFGFIIVPNALSCSMFKITMHGKTMIGNNEDYWNPNTRIWFEQGKKGEFGAAYVGYDNFWPQGGINQAGLVFDGFSEDYLVIRDTLGKKPLDPNFLKEIMKKCATVVDVKNYLSQYNLSGLETSMFFFVDKTGRYLVAEGDSLIIGNKDYYLVSNFYPSQVKDESKVPIAFYQKGRRFMEDQRDTSVSYCASLMDTMHQERDWGAGTLYTTVYDLNAGKIYLYFFHDYTRVIEFNLNKELEKEDYILVIPALFPENKKGQDFLNNYNAVEHELELLKDESILMDSILFSRVENTLYAKDTRLVRIFSDKVREIAGSWIDKGNYIAAIKVYKINVKLAPDSWMTYQVLADAYVKNKQNELAISNYEKSLDLNPDNVDGKKQLKQLKKSSKK
jgi:hypothetical protein